MPANYTLKTVSEFAAAHTLRHYEGPCSRMHGHNWKVEVELTGTELDEAGMIIDFRQIKRATREIAERLDHRYLNEIAPFDERNPTAENIARYFFEELQQMFSQQGNARISAVTLWETDRACARFSMD